MKNNIIKSTTCLILLVVSILLISGCSQIQKTTDEGIKGQVEDLNKTLEKEAPENLKTCTPEVYTKGADCPTQTGTEICGYDHTVYGDGKIKDHGLEYTSACHYCRLFGEGGVMELGDTKVTALGYKEGKCN